MASLNLPRMLNPRKTSLEIERENFEKSQALALKKAINKDETAIKQKHVRAVILGTFHTQSANIFWANARCLEAKDNQIVAWKLCHVIHKILREGHCLCLVNSQSHCVYLEELGTYWGHMHDGYGKMIQSYTLLLVTKLKFHYHNQRFPGDLDVSSTELDSIGGNDINSHFELSVEMFDYLDKILDLQAVVFDSLDMARSNSMTCAGQCRLATLIPCIQDASKLYDFCVRILFKLHLSLPMDTLAGHRERFYKQFRQLKQFYQSSSNLQYFKDLISIPPLPENPPNFLLQSELRSYITHEVAILNDHHECLEDDVQQHLQQPSLRKKRANQQEQQRQPSIEDNNHVSSTLIDTSDGGSVRAQNGFVQQQQQENHHELEFLQNQCTRLSDQMEAIRRKHKEEVSALMEKMSQLETDLVKKDSELVQERQVKEELISQAFTVAQNQDSEQKVKDEKFNKLKDIYYKLRADHIQKLREKADVDKKLTTIVKQLQDSEDKCNDLHQQIDQLQTDVLHYESEHNSSSNKSNNISEEELLFELVSLRNDKELLAKETEILKKSLTEAYKQRDQLQYDLDASLHEKDEQKMNQEAISDKLLEAERNLMTTHLSNEENVKQLVECSMETCEKIVGNAIHEIDNPAFIAVVCTTDYLRSMMAVCRGLLTDEKRVAGEINKSSTAQKSIVYATRVAHMFATLILYGKATSHNCTDITFGDKMAEVCKSLGEHILRFLRTKDDDPKSIAQLRSQCIDCMDRVAVLSEAIDSSSSTVPENVENLADLLEAEMCEMVKTIEEEAARIERMRTASSTTNNGIKLEVNGKILDSCTALMEAIRVLVQKSRLLQDEIVAQGRGGSSAASSCATELFYKRNHQWTNGFISAAKAVAVAAKFFVNAADTVVSSGAGKLDQLTVATNQITVSTVQLVVASRVKADRNSANLGQLSRASKAVSEATATVVATVKQCAKMIDEETERLDVDSLTLHQAKRLEMEAQVRLLELETAVDQQRITLAQLRKRHYHIAA